VFRVGLSRYNSGMRLALKLHPDSTSAAASSVEVEITRPQESTLLLSYVVIGKTSGLRLPSIVTPARADELWRHTCFEAFLSVPSHTGYYEFNFSPSTQWAAYRFSDYRAGMAAFEIEPPKIEVTSTTETYMLRASLGLKQQDLAQGARLGLSAVIEEIDGNKSYWALAHAPGKPDFHRTDCFTHELS
jgi:hypothetical protein